MLPEVGEAVVVHRGGAEATEGCPVPLFGIASVGLSARDANTYERHLRGTLVLNHTEEDWKVIRRGEDSGGRQKTKPETFVALCYNIF